MRYLYVCEACWAQWRPCPVNIISLCGNGQRFRVGEQVRPEVVRRLLLAGADAARAFEGVTPLEKARAKGHAACAELLEDP